LTEALHAATIFQRGRLNFKGWTQSGHGSAFYRKLQDFLQEVLYFYQKHPVEAFRQARINYGEGFEARSLLRRHATTLFFHPPLFSSPFI